MSDPRYDERPGYRDDLGRPVADDTVQSARSSNAMWGWIAGLVFLVIVLALIFGPGTGNNESQTANNSPPAANSLNTAPPVTGQPVNRSPTAPPAQPSTTGQGSSGR